MQFVLPQSPLHWVLIAVAAATAIIIAASLLFLSAVEAARRVPLPRAFVDDPMPGALITRGPFLFIRHPFYVSYTLAWREERQLEARFGEAYRAYRLGTGYVLPPLFRLAGRSLQ